MISIYIKDWDSSGYGGDLLEMGRTIPTFSTAIEMEKRRWKPFRNALYYKSDRREFDKMFDDTIPEGEIRGTIELDTD